MNALNIFGFKPGNSDAISADTGDGLFLGISVTTTTIQAFLWQAGAPSQLVAASEIRTYHDKQLAVQADECLQQLGKASENVNKTLFAVPADWVQGTDLVAARKPLLQKVSKDLSLEPVGYVVTAEAVGQYILQSQPQAHSLLVMVSAQDVTLGLLHNNTIKGFEQVGRSDSGAQDVVEALARLKATLESSGASHWPTSMMIVSAGLSDKELQALQQELVNFDWQQLPGFVQLPTIETIPAQTVVTAVVQAGGTAVMSQLGMQAQASAPNHKDFDPQSMASTHFEADDASTLDGDNFQSMSTAQSNQGSSTQTANVANNTQASSFGIPMNDPSLSQPTPAPVSLHADTVRTGSKSWFQSHKRMALLGLGAGLVVTVISIVGLLLTNATVIVQATLTTETITDDLQVALNADVTSTDSEIVALDAQEVTTTVSGTQNIATTGVKLIGEQATGSVEITNKTDSDKTFDAGTVVKVGSLEFTLDETTTVEGSTTTEDDSGERREYGKATASVTASDIGADSNIDQGAEMQVASFSSSTYTAESVEAFTGGSSREVRVVSKEDQDDLLNQLTAQLRDDAEAAFVEQAQGSTSIVPTGRYQVVSSDYNHEIGDEVAEVTLALELSFTGLQYSKEDLLPIAKSVLAENVPEGYELSNQDPSVLSQPVNDPTDADTEALTQLEVNISAPAKPTLNEIAWFEAISGQPFDGAAAVLRGRADFSDAKLTTQPSIARWFIRSVPKDQNRVEFVYSSN